MSKDILKNLLEIHDNSYEYSDDRNIWAKGFDQESRILSLIKKINCPYSYSELVDYITKQAIHFYKLDAETGRYYKEEWKTNWNMYQPAYNELISEELYNQIDNWFKLKE